MNLDMYRQICSELERLRLNGNPYWNVGTETVEIIVSYIKCIPACRMLEVGTSNGYTALRLVSALEDVGGMLTTIESHQERGDIAAKNFQLAEVEEIITLIRGHAPEIFRTLSGTFDLVFLDATKYEHVSYVEQLLPCLSTQVIIIADNVLSHEEAMKPFVDYVRSLSDFSVEIIDVGTGLLVAQR